MSLMRNLFGGSGGPGGGIFNFGKFGNFFQQFQQFMQNPIGAMMSSGMNIPQNITNSNNPEAIVNYLRSSGQMSDDQYNQVAQMAQMAQNFLPKMF